MVKTKPKTSAEYSRFENALRTVLTVSHSEMQNRIKAAKREREQQRQKRASDRASREKD